MITVLFLVSAQLSPAASAPAAGEEIVVTASLTPVPAGEAPASVTIFDEARVEALGLTRASDVLRLAPGVAVAASGAPGTETVVRIRGAESNHSLIFIDGIAFNDIAAANAGRFDGLATTGLGRIELIRGPQSALWGSEALGGVVAMSSPDPLGDFRAEGSAAYGSRDALDVAAQVVSGGGQAGITATAAFSRSDGIDILGGGAGDRDGFETLTLGAKGLARLGGIEIGAAARHIRHDVSFDGFDPATFQRADTADRSRAETVAARGWIGFGADSDAAWSGRIEGQYLNSENRNRVGALRTSDTAGRRVRYGGRLARRLGLGTTRHEVTVAIEREEEEFSFRDRQFNGASDRDDTRARTSFVAAWRAHWGETLVTDVAVRHDDFNRFEDDTTFRANAVLNLGRGFALLAGYGEGIAQPSFIELFGFPGFPFTGNPALRPEHSRGFEGGLRWRRAGLSLEGVAFSNHLRDEIVDDFSVFPSTVVNAAGKSRRRGVELSAEWHPAPELRVGANYTYLDAREQSLGGAAALREVRRPKHSANAFADWRHGPVTLGGALAYVGARTDRDFDLFPAPVVRLGDYLLGSARIGYRVLPQLELFARAENIFDANYRDLVGYESQGRSIHAGLRVIFGD